METIDNSTVYHCAAAALIVIAALGIFCNALAVILYVGDKTVRNQLHSQKYNRPCFDKIIRALKTKIDF